MRDKRDSDDVGENDGSLVATLYNGHNPITQSFNDKSK
jgi:hypothetical protein